MRRRRAHIDLDAIDARGRRPVAKARVEHLAHHEIHFLDNETIASTRASLTPRAVERDGYRVEEGDTDAWASRARSQELVGSMTVPLGLGALGAALPASRKAKRESEADAMRAKGNERFAAGDLVSAIALYDEALTLNGSDASAHANKAECYLRARAFDKALESAREAREHARGNKSTELKALYKMAMALNGLARYVGAAKVAEEGAALAKDPEDAAVRVTLEKVKLECEMLKEQAFAGMFDLGSLYLNRMNASFRRCADYVGSVKIAKLNNGRRGVVTTSAVSAGDLLVAQSPLSAAPFGKDVERHLMLGLYEAARANAADWAILKALPTSSEDEEKDAPDVSLFRKHISSANRESSPVPETPEELAFLPKIVTNCAISGRKLCGVWSMPSFMNHSCIPNAHRINVGKVMLIFASKDLPVGAEVTIKYYDTLIPKRDRDAFATRRGYECNCVRCAFESEGDVGEEEKKKLEAEGKDEGVGPITRAVSGCKRKFKAVLKAFKEELAEYRRTKGQIVPNVLPLIELREWFEARLAALELDSTQIAMARMSVYSIYETLHMAFSCTGAGESRHQLIKTMLQDLSIVDPGGFNACKLSTMLANGARRTFGVNSEEVVEATNIMVEAHRVRYGAIDGEDLVEIVRRTESSVTQDEGEFCEL